MKVAKLFFLMLIPSIAQPHTNIQQDTPFLSLEEAKALVPYHPMDEEENIKISDEFYKNFDAIREHLGDAFGGIWLSFDENGKAYPVIAVTTKEKSLKKEWLIHGAVVVQVPYSVKELTKIQDFITDAIGSNDASDELAVYSSYVNEKKNKVSIRAPLKNKQKIMAKIKEMGIDTSIILFEEESHPITLYANLYAGQAIASAQHGASNSNYRCTAGFNASIGIYQLTLTAGHCASYPSLQSVYFNLHNSPASNFLKGPYIGDYIRNDFANGLDSVMFVNANWAHALRGQIKAGLSFYNVGPPLEHTSWLENRQICRMGMSSGWRCGRFLQANMKYTINGVPFYLSEAEVCASPGDSGGPMILSAGNNALGLLTGAKNDNSSGRGTCAASVGGGSPPITLFQPIMPIIRAHPGLTIMTR